ncbi:zona pellucida-like domain containing protein 2 [Dermatophagoides farinae]|uniref:Zona pellucida-like domain containing protein 2 n=1 Tax=Dermatophagoides farinae TaxID=6954 RepID=A0A9D4NUB1_DERFA|nr:zona pellucida-like domain containing protein 2 [Dermatophagoides farinae]
MINLVVIGSGHNIETVVDHNFHHNDNDGSFDHSNHHHHHNSPVVAESINNRPRLRNGTIFHFGGDGDGHHYHPLSYTSSSNVINNNNNNRFKARPITGSVIHVSDRINVKDDDDDDDNNGNTRFKEVERSGMVADTSTDIGHHHNSNNQRHQFHHPLHNQVDHIDRDSIHKYRPQTVHHYEIRQNGGAEISHYNRSAHDGDRLITSAHQGGRTDLESYHRAAVSPDVSSALVVNNNDNGYHGSTGDHHYRGVIVDVTDTHLEGNNRFQTGYHSGHHQNKTQINAINNRTAVIHHSGAPYTFDSGHQNRIHQTSGLGMNRTIVQPGNIGTNVYSSGHIQDNIGVDTINRTIGHHYGHQQQASPINRTAINSGSNIYSSNTIDNVANNQTQYGSGVQNNHHNHNRINNNNNVNNRIQIQPSSLVTSNEYDTRNRVNNNNNNRQATNLLLQQQPGTAVVSSLNSLDNVDVEAINKARIYAEQANEEQAKKHAQNVVRLAATDQLESEIITNRTRAYLSCESGEMIVKINFTEPFRGVGYADYDRSSPCKFYGDGGRYYEMRLPLKGCGTKQEAPRIFINNIILRFHRALELEEDEIKTIVCRYPPPLAPPPPLIAAPILEQPPPAVPFIPAKLSEVELLLIVSALLFLTLLLLGIGIGYYCLKKRKVKVVRKFIPPTELPYFPPPSISSEEHSIISEGSIIHRDDYQFQNLGFIPEAKLSYMDDIFYHDQDMIENDVVQTQQNVLVPPVPLFSTRKFDDRFVTHASETDVDTDYEIDRLIVPKKPIITKLITDRYFVTPKTTTEIIDEVTTQRVIVPPKKPITTKYIDETLVTPQVDLEIDEITTNQRVFGPKKPLTTQKVDDTFVHSEQETDVIDDVSKYRIHGPTKMPQITTTGQDDYFRTDLYEIDEVIDDLDETIINAMQPPITQTTEHDDYITHSRDVEEFVDDTTHRLVSGKKPKIMVKNIDDFYVTNITETETNEHVTKIGRSMPNLTMEIDYEEEILEEKDTRLLDETKHITGFDVRMRSIPRKPMQQPPPPTTTTTTTTQSISETTITTKIDEIIRVLDNPPRDKIPNIDEYFMLPTRNRFRQIIFTDEVFRTLIIESTTIEEYVERIQNHPTYGPMFEPPTWEVIFRLLSLPEVNQRRPLPRPTRYSDTYRSGFSAQEVRSVTEEDVTFTRSRLSAAHYVPLPDYPMDDNDDHPSQQRSGNWAKQLPDPRHYECHSPDFTPIKPAFTTTRPYGSGRRSKPFNGTISPTSSVFGTRRLENPYTSTNTTNASSKRLYEYDFRPYSPDLDALSLEPSQSYLSYSGSIRKRNQFQQAIEEREEIKSTTETNVYDWKRYE